MAVVAIFSGPYLHVKARKILHFKRPVGPGIITIILELKRSFVEENGESVDVQIEGRI
jgi:hypothetical protein